MSELILKNVFLEIYAFNANSVDPDQTPRVAASDQVLHFLPISVMTLGINSLQRNKYYLAISTSCTFHRHLQPARAIIFQEGAAHLSTNVGVIEV